MMAANTQTSKTLADLFDREMLARAPLEPGLGSIAVAGLALDSRKVAPGDLFLAVEGMKVDGRSYIEAAIKAGAVAVLAEQGPGWTGINRFQNIPVIAVDNLGAEVSAIASRFYGHPSRQLPLVGVTGTNGKTSCTQLYMQLVNLLGKRCGVVGTLGIGVDGMFEETPNTTPDAITLQRTLSDWLLSGVDLAAMEVSSHGLEQGRVAAIEFDQAIFTNLTRDHLDYHGSMRAYAAAKSRLFRMSGLKAAIINADDDFSMDLVAEVATGVEIFCHSLRPAGKTTPTIDVWAENVRYHERGASAELHTPWGEFEINSSLLGAFNLSNLIAVFIAAVNSGFRAEQVAAAIGQLKTVAGRMELVPSATGIVAVVDYAHTPDALEKALLAMRQHTTGKIWCVFGCGGDRDTGKRPLMGGVAQRYADHVVVTSDNPRNEDPALIINGILGGITRPTLVEEDRAKAIAFAIQQAAVGDSVLVAGKGHEPYQQVGDTRLPFSDIQQVRLALSARQNQTGGQS